MGGRKIGRVVAALGVGAAIATSPSGLSAQEADWSSAAAPDPERFAPAIARFAQADQARPPAPCGFLFLGSSTIRFWKSLAEDMAPYRVVNRGLAGSRITDVDYFFDQLVTAYRPRAIVFYGGENDLWAGESATALVGDFQRFLALKTKALGATPVYFISLKPSLKRLGQRAVQAEVNRRIAALAATRKDLTYVDVVPAMIDAGGAPKDVFRKDGLHMRPEGYALWTSVVKPDLARAAPGACVAARAPATVRS
jgi:lysophospholipase L1-like esterase